MNEQKVVKVVEYWIGYCKEVKGAKSEADFVEAMNHLVKNYSKIEAAYDVAMKGKV